MTQSWLITGPPGSGRVFAALAFAAALQCDAGGCGECHECVTVQNGSHIDVFHLATNKVNISIEEARQLVTTASQSPANGKWRVIIVEDSDRMTTRTSNVLLKAVEEPSARTVWLLCAPSAHDVLVTIKSRCRLVRLTLPSDDQVAALLRDREGVEAGLAQQAAGLAQGHIGNAVRLAANPEDLAVRSALLGTVVGLSSPAEAVLAAGKIVDEAVAKGKLLTETENQEERRRLLTSLGLDDTQTPPAAYRPQLRQLEEEQKRKGTRLQRDVLTGHLADLQSLYRDVLVTKLASSTPVVNGQLLSEIQRLSKRSSSEEVLSRFEAIADANARLSANVPPLLVFEALFLSLSSYSPQLEES